MGFHYAHDHADSGTAAGKKKSYGVHRDTSWGTLGVSRFWIILISTYLAIPSGPADIHIFHVLPCGVMHEYSEAPCGNLHTSCNVWAQRGECTINPAYMTPNCAKACQQCEAMRCRGVHICGTHNLLTLGACESWARAALQQQIQSMCTFRGYSIADI